MWRNRDACALLVGVENSAAAIEMKSTVSVWFSNFISGHMCKRIEMRVLKTYVYTYVHSCIIHSSQKVEATQVSIDRWMGKQNVFQPLKGRKFWHMLQHRWTLRTLWLVKWASYKRTNTGWFHLYEVPRVVKFIETESRMVVPRGWEEGRMGS